MAIARLLQCGFEWGAPELTSLFPGLVATSPIAQAGLYRYTGYSALQFSSSGEGRWTDDFGAISQARMNIMQYSTAGSAGKSPDIAFLLDGVIGSPVIRLRYDYDNQQLEAVCGTTEVATYAVALNDGKWRQIGIDVKIDGAAGWFYVYIDGAEVIGFDGDTNDGGTDFDRVGLGGIASGDNWANLSLDDFYIDSTTGEGSPAVPPLYRFFMYKPSGDGNYSNWLGSDGNSVNNYLLVDEDPPNTSDFVEHDTTTEEDTYATSIDASGGIIPPSVAVQSVIVQSYSRKDDGATALELKVMTREDGVDEVGAAQALTVNWDVYWERFTTDPGSAAWDLTAVNAMEIGVYVE